VGRVGFELAAQVLHVLAQVVGLLVGPSPYLLQELPLADERHQAGFAAWPAKLMVPDARIRVLHLTGQGTVTLGWNEALALPGYAIAFALIDTLIDSVSAG
jgi:hypothetical protein